LEFADVGAFTGILIDLLGKIAPNGTIDAALDSSKLTRDAEKQKENDM
jgi:hypothetical protein